MLKRISVLSLSVFLIFFSSMTFAWNALGHMMIANIAYQQLKPEAKAKLDQLALNLKRDYPETQSFLEMAYWLDSLRGQKIETYSHWHYIDVSFSKDGTPLKNVIDTDNAVWALTQIKKVVKNNKANINERARFLAFLTHITGDLHQPLHCVTYFSKNHPDGDRGGNEYFVKNGNDRINLHRLWDGGVGYFEFEPNSEKAMILSKTVMALYPKIYFGKRVSDLNFDHWTQEGIDNAQNYVYKIAEDSRVEDYYRHEGQKLAQQQIALAGYRLGELLNQLL